MSGLYGALFSGVTGLNAQTQSMAIISDNITNVNTIGYKTTQARFSTLVTNSITQGLYTSGGVRSLPLQNLEAQGLLQGSAVSTDMAINGNGFFVVSTSASPGADTGEYLFTRAGSFRPDDDGNLVNTAGYYLQAWPYNQQADQTNSALTEDGIVFGTDGLPVNKTALTNVETVNVSDLTGLAEATSAVEVRINLDASQPQQATAIDYLIGGQGLGGLDTTRATYAATYLTGVDTMAGGQVIPDFERSITIFDAQGVSHDFTMRFLKKGVDPNASLLSETVTSTSTTGTGTTLQVPALIGRTDIPTTGGSFTFANGSATPTAGTVTYESFDPNTGTFTFPSSVVWSGPATADLTFPVYQPVSNQWAFELSSNDAYQGPGTSAIAENTVAVAGATNGDPDQVSLTITDATLQGYLNTNGSDGGSITIDGTTYAYTNVTQVGADYVFDFQPGAFTAAELGALPANVDISVQTNAAHVSGIFAFGTVQFNADGSLDANNSLIYQADYSAGGEPDVLFRQSTFNVAQDFEIVWNPATTGASGGDTTALVPQIINTIDFGTNAQGDGLSQFQNPSTLYSSDVNGAVFGNFAGITVDELGRVIANYTNGLSRQTHTVPLATVPNPAGLSNETGNAYQVTATSGTFNLLEPGTAGAGLVVGAALEQSTTDLGTEFTNMIITQRAYSAAGRIISTTDQLLEELVRLGR